MRYASLSVYDLKPPGPVLRTLSDAEIRQFYYQKYGAEKWEEDFGRNVSFIITTNQKALSRCVRACICTEWSVLLDAVFFGACGERPMFTRSAHARTSILLTGARWTRPTR